MPKTKSLDFSGQTLNLGIDVHGKSWKVSVRSGGVFFCKMSIDPSPQVLYRTITRAYPGATLNSVYEAGFSGFWAHRELVALGINNIIVNPADVPTTDKEKDRKSDPIDSNKLSRELDKGCLQGIYVPTEEMQSFRSLSRLLDQYRKRATQIKNRISSLLHFTGCEKSTTNEHSRWSRGHIDYLKNLGMSMAIDREILDDHIGELLHVRSKQLTLLRRIRQIIENNETLRLLRSIPGIGVMTSFTVYTELMDIHRFRNFDRLASYVGLVPSTSASGDNERVRGISYRHAKYLRYMLIESAWHAIRKDPVLTHSFLNLSRRMPKQKAIVHIAKKLLSRIRYVWKNREKYEIGIVE